MSHGTSGTNVTLISSAPVPIGAGLEATAIRVTLPTDGTGKINAAQSGTWTVRLSDGTDVADVLDLANSNPLTVAIVNGSGDQITSFGGGTQYTVDDALGATPTGTLSLAIRDDTLSGLTPVEGDAIGLRVNQNGALWVINSGIISVSGTVTVAQDTPTDLKAEATLAAGQTLATVTTVSTVTSLTQFNGQVITLGAGAVAAGTLRATLASDDPAVASLGTLDNIVSGSGVNVSQIGGQAVDLGNGATGVGTLRVTISSDTTGVLSVDDNGSTLSVDDGGGVITVDGTVAATQSGTWSVRTQDGSGNALTSATRGSEQALSVQLVDGSGNQITSFVGTQYTEGDTDASITGNAMMMEVAANTLQPVQGTVADGLLINLGTNNDVTVTNATATNLKAEVVGTGTFAVQVSGDALTSLQLIDDIVNGAGVNVTALGGSNIDLGNGAAGTGTLRVTLANNSTGIVSLTTSTASIGKLAANSGVDIGDVDVTSVVPGSGATNLGKDIDSVVGGTDTGVAALVMRKDTPAGITPADGDYTSLIVDANGRLHVIEPSASGSATSLAVIDDWDESDRAKVNIIVGQSGVTAGAGAVAANTQRITLASDDPVVISAQIMDDWDESDRAKANIIVGQAGITAGAGAVAANTPRITHASDDPVTTSVQLLDDVVYAEDAGHNSGDKGVFIFAVRNDQKTALSGSHGDYTPLSTDKDGHLLVEAFAPGTIDVFGSLVTGSINNYIDIQFYRDTPANLMTVTTAVSGSATATGGMATFASAAGAGSYAKGVSTTSTVYTAGGEIYTLFTAAFPAAGSGDTYQRIGLYDTNNGFFIGYEGNVFNATVRSGASDSSTAKASFSADVLTGAAGSSFTRNGSPEAIDLTKLNVWRIRFGWVGSAPIIFEVLSPDGVFVPFHVIKRPNLAAVPHIQNADLPITIDVNNGATGGVLQLLTNCVCAGTTQRLSKINSTITTSTLAELTRAVITGETTAGGGGFVNVKVSPSGAVTISGDITSIIPGTAATNLGKAEDAAHSSGDVGVMMLAVRSATASDKSVGNTDGDYEPLQVDANGRLHVIEPSAAGSATSLAVIDDWDESDRAKVNIIVGQAGISAGAGAVAADTPRVTLASDDPAVAALQIIDNIVDGSGVNISKINGAVPPIGAGTEAAAIRVTLPTDGTGKVNAAQSGTWTVRLSDGTDVVDVLDLTNSNPLTVAIVDGSGDQITTFGGGTQYTEADTDASITGTAMLMEGAGNALVVVQGTASDGVLVNLGTNNDVTVTNATATNLKAEVVGTGTFVVQVDGSALTSLQLIDDAIVADDDTFTPATTKVMMAGFEADEASIDSVNEGDAGAARMTLDRKQIVTLQPHTAGGLSLSRDIDLDNGTLTVVKNAAGQLYGWTITNTSTATVFVKFYDATSGTLGTGTPVMTIGIPGNATDDTMSMQSFGGLGIAFGTGICVGAGTGVAEADNTDPGANAVVANIYYM